MSPRSHDDQLKRVIQSSKLEALKVCKESHLIHKPSSSSGSSSSSSSGSSLVVQQRNPVIIYTHSPKEIHTQPRDFMALVQKLTGFSSSDDLPASKPSSSPFLTPPRGSGTFTRMNSICESFQGDTSPSVNTGDGSMDMPVSSAFVSPMFDAQNPFFSDLPPLFPPAAMPEYYYSPHHLYRFPDPVFSTTNLGNPL